MSSTTGNYDLPDAVVKLARENAQLRARVEQMIAMRAKAKDEMAASEAEVERLREIANFQENLALKNLQRAERAEAAAEEYGWLKRQGRFYDAEIGQCRIEFDAPYRFNLREIPRAALDAAKEEAK